MRHGSKYIVFGRNTRGKNGEQYLSGVKYMVKRETPDRYHVAGGGVFPRGLEGKSFAVGNVVQDF